MVSLFSSGYLPELVRLKLALQYSDFMTLPQSRIAVETGNLVAFVVKSALKSQFKKNITTKSKSIMVDVMLLALALSMDAFAVSIGLGSKIGVKTDQPLALALTSGIYFGLFQALMPFIGFLGGHGVLGWIEHYASWIAFILLLFIGIKMVYESFSEGIEDDISQITHRVMLTLAIATSVDAMAAGFSLPLLGVNALLACSVIGLVTFFFSFIGVFIGRKSGTWLESQAELLGGVVLIIMAFKFLLI